MNILSFRKSRETVDPLPKLVDKYPAPHQQDFLTIASNLLANSTQLEADSQRHLGLVHCLRQLHDYCLKAPNTESPAMVTGKLIMRTFDWLLFTDAMNCPVQINKQLAGLLINVLSYGFEIEPKDIEALCTYHQCQAASNYHCHAVSATN